MRAPATTAAKLLPAFIIVVVLIAGGTVGFHLAFGGPWALGLYRMVVTVSTLGDGRVVPHTPGQYLLISLLSGLGYAAWAVVIAVLTGTLVSLDLRSLWEGRRVTDRIAALHGHTIVVGGGRVGQQVAAELRRLGKEAVMIDRDPERAARLTESGYLTLCRDVTDDGVFAEAGAARARSVVLALPDDAQNLYALLAVRDVAPAVSVIARAESARAERHLRALGVARVVMPTALGGKRLARLVARPVHSDFLDTLIDEAGLAVREQVVQAGDPLAGVAVRSIRSALGEGVTLLAIYRDGRMLALPSADMRIAAGDTLLLVVVADRPREA